MECYYVGFVFGLMIVVSSVAYATTSTQWECEFPTLINFGDSNSDTGSGSIAFGIQHPTFGDTFVGLVPQRASDRRLLIDFIAENLTLPYLSSKFDHFLPNHTHGVNFAMANATIRHRNSFDLFSLFSQYKQFKTFLYERDLYTQGILSHYFPKPGHISRGLFTIDIGLSDVAYLAPLEITDDEFIAGINIIAEQYELVLKLLYDTGARSFWIHNIGPFGCLPGMMRSFSTTTNLEYDHVGCSIKHNEVVRKINNELRAVVEKCRKELPWAAFTLVDMYTAKYTLISQATMHGFEDPMVVSCGHEVVGKCEEPSRRVSWDGINFTDAANQWLFQHIVNGSFSDPQVPLHMACPTPGYFIKGGERGLAI